MAVAFVKVHNHTVYAPAMDGRPRILDIGANHGQFAQTIHQEFGADVCMVEANPALFEKLSAQGTFPIWHCALTDKDGTISFNIAQNDEGSSILPLPAESPLGCTLHETTTVPARTLGSILQEVRWDRVALVKMDIEGAEVGVLDSLSPEMLARVDQFSIEFHGNPIFRFGLHHQTEACLRRMKKLGFLVLDFSSKQRYDVLMINTRTVALPLIHRTLWGLKYDPPLLVHRLLSKIRRRANKILMRERSAAPR